MKVSIITVCFNSHLTIKDSINSVLLQSYKNIEYIIIDGASTDGTLSILDKYKDSQIRIISEPDKGLYDAINKGLRLSTGDIIGILNSDDVYEDKYVVSNVVNHFLENPESDLVFGDVVFVHPSDMKTITRYYNANHFKTWKLRFGWMPPHPATFIRKSAYEKTGLYSLNYKISSDYEMFVRMLAIKNLKYTRLDKVLVRMRTGGISSAGISSNILLNKEIVKACRSNGLYTNIFLILTKTPFKLLELLHKPSRRKNT